MNKSKYGNNHVECLNKEKSLDLVKFYLYYTDKLLSIPQTKLLTVSFPGLNNITKTRYKI